MCVCTNVVVFLLLFLFLKSLSIQFLRLLGPVHSCTCDDDVVHCLRTLGAIGKGGGLFLSCHLAQPGFHEATVTRAASYAAPADRLVAALFSAPVAGHNLVFAAVAGFSQGPSVRGTG